MELGKGGDDAEIRFSIMPTRGSMTPPNTSCVIPTLLHIDNDALFASVIREGINSAQILARSVGWCQADISQMARLAHLGPQIVVLGVDRSEDLIGTKAEYARSISRAGVIITASFLTDVFVHFIERQRVASFVWKDENVCFHLHQALNRVAQGLTYYTGQYLTKRKILASRSDAFYKILTDREQRLMAYFGDGLTDSEIANATRRSIISIRSTRQRIMNRLGVHRLADLMQYAAKCGFDNFHFAGECGNNRVGDPVVVCGEANLKVRPI